MSWAMRAAIAALIFAAGGAGGIKWQLGVQARVDLAAAQVRASESKRQIKVMDEAAGAHASALAVINHQLGKTHEYIATLSGRECLDAGTIGVLNAIGSQPMRAAADDSESTTTAIAGGTGLRFATERDTATAIAVCRARYAEVSSQVNQILDIEARRNPTK